MKKTRTNYILNPNLYKLNLIFNYKLSKEQSDIILLFENSIDKVKIDINNNKITLFVTQRKYYTGLEYIHLFEEITKNKESDGFIINFDYIIYADEYNNGSKIKIVKTILFKGVSFKKWPVITSDFNSKNNDKLLKFNLSFDNYDVIDGDDKVINLWMNYYSQLNN